MDCPPLPCDNPLPLFPGECCARCEDDPCNFMDNTTNAHGKPCSYEGYSYASGQTFNGIHSRCTTCECKVS